eukprot:m.207994 g.207994  ORF g.207994 m.207994 type:complete len:324 (-) comp15447_c0_seq4:903-1874(-)
MEPEDGAQEVVLGPRTVRVRHVDPRDQIRVERVVARAAKAAGKLKVARDESERPRWLDAPQDRRNEINRDLFEVDRRPLSLAVGRAGQEHHVGQVPKHLIRACHLGDPMRQGPNHRDGVRSNPCRGPGNTVPLQLQMAVQRSNEVPKAVDEATGGFRTVAGVHQRPGKVEAWDVDGFKRLGDFRVPGGFHSWAGAVGEDGAVKVPPCAGNHPVHPGELNVFVPPRFEVGGGFVAVVVNEHAASAPIPAELHLGDIAGVASTVKALEHVRVEDFVVEPAGVPDVCNREEPGQEHERWVQWWLLGGPRRSASAQESPRTTNCEKE